MRSIGHVVYGWELNHGVTSNWFDPAWFSVLGGARKLVFISNHSYKTTHNKLWFYFAELQFVVKIVQSVLFPHLDCKWDLLTVQTVMYAALELNSVYHVNSNRYCVQLSFLSNRDSGFVVTHFNNTSCKVAKQSCSYLFRVQRGPNVFDAVSCGFQFDIFRQRQPFDSVSNHTF